MPSSTSIRRRRNGGGVGGDDGDLVVSVPQGSGDIGLIRRPDARGARRAVHPDFRGKAHAAQVQHIAPAGFFVKRHGFCIQRAAGEPGKPVFRASRQASVSNGRRRTRRPFVKPAVWRSARSRQAAACAAVRPPGRETAPARKRYGRFVQIHAAYSPKTSASFHATAPVGSSHLVPQRRADTAPFRQTAADRPTAASAACRAPTPTPNPVLQAPALRGRARPFGIDSQHRRRGSVWIQPGETARGNRPRRIGQQFDVAAFRNNLRL